MIGKRLVICLGRALGQPTGNHLGLNKSFVICCFNFKCNMLCLSKNILFVRMMLNLDLIKMNVDHNKVKYT